MNTKTEAEAIQCWCPFARTYGGNGSAIGRSGGDFPRDPISGAHCIASKCMAWRWRREPAAGITDTLDRDLSKNPEQGYCGLAQR